MIHNPVDVASRVSAELSALIEQRVNDPDIRQPVTLAAMRIFVAGQLAPEAKEAERRHHFDVSESLLDELDALIDEFGGHVPAFDLTQQVAGEALSEVIESVMNDDSRDNPPTLATVRDAILSGLPASLVGAGEFEEEESETLLAEIDGLIGRYGDDALAERFLYYE